MEKALHIVELAEIDSVCRVESARRKPVEQSHGDYYSRAHDCHHFNSVLVYGNNVPNGV